MPRKSPLESVMRTSVPVIVSKFSELRWTRARTHSGGRATPVFPGNRCLPPPDVRRCCASNAREKAPITIASTAPIDPKTAFIGIKWNHKSDCDLTIQKSQMPSDGVARESLNSKNPTKVVRGCRNKMPRINPSTPCKATDRASAKSLFDDLLYMAVTQFSTSCGNLVIPAT